MTSTKCKNKYGNIEWRNEQGHLHRENGPAIERASGTKEWYVHDQRHREDGPAVESASGTKEWYVNDNLHRENGPAVEDSNGTKEWYVHGCRHRENGPAIEWANGTKEWYVNDNLHRENGPAVEWPDGHVEYWLNDQEGPNIEQQVKENIARIQAEKEKQDLTSELFQDNEISAKINTSLAKNSKKL